MTLARMVHYFVVLFVCSGPQVVQELWAIMSDKLLEAIRLEPDAEIVAIMVDSLCKVCLGVWQWVWSE